MKFFLPLAQDEAEAERVYALIKSHSGSATDERIYKISYAHNGKNYVSVVGEADAYSGEMVIAILHSATSAGLYFICTPNRGVVRGAPYYVGSPSAIVLFD